MTSLGSPSSPVLGDDHGSPFSRLQILGDQKDAPGEDVCPDIQDHIVADPLGSVIAKAASRVRRQHLGLNLADDLFPEVLPKRLCPLGELRSGIVRDLLQQELVASDTGNAEDMLDMVFDLFDLALLACLRIESGGGLVEAVLGSISGPILPAGSKAARNASRAALEPGPTGFRI